MVPDVNHVLFPNVSRFERQEWAGVDVAVGAYADVLDSCGAAALGVHPEFFEEQVFWFGSVLFVHLCYDAGVEGLSAAEHEEHFAGFLNFLQVTEHFKPLRISHK